MEMNVRALAEQTFHRLHGLPFGDLPLQRDIPEGGVLRMRMDAHTDRGEPRVYAVFPVSDLAQLPGGIRLPEPPGIGLPGSDVFFMNGPDGHVLYVDTDRQERLWLEIMDDACDADLELLEVPAELKLICRLPKPFNGLPGDIDPSAVAGFEANGFEHVPMEVGIEMLSNRRGPELSLDDPSIPGF